MKKVVTTVAAEPSTGVWTTVLPTLDDHNGRAYVNRRHAERRHLTLTADG